MIYKAADMKQDNTDRMFDKRVVRRNISTGRIQSDDYDRFLNALPDAAENIKPTEEGGDNDGYDERPPEAQADAAQPAGDAAAGFGSPAPGALPDAGIPAAPAAPPVAPVAAPTAAVVPPAAPVASPAAPAAPEAAPAPAAPAPGGLPGTEPPTGA